jgi:hypothetical protein
VLILVTGPKDSGKTTLCQRQFELAREAGWDVAGVLSPARLQEGHKLGIETVDLRSGRRRLLAHAREPSSAPNGLHTDAWTFDETVMAWGNDVLRAATPCDLLIVDELGPLEFERNRGWTDGLVAVDSGDYRHGLVVIRPQLLPAARARWPHAQVVDVSQTEQPGFPGEIAPPAGDRLFPHAAAGRGSRRRGPGAG